MVTVFRLNSDLILISDCQMCSVLVPTTLKTKVQTSLDHLIFIILIENIVKYKMVYASCHFIIVQFGAFKTPQFSTQEHSILTFSL